MTSIPDIPSNPSATQAALLAHVRAMQEMIAGFTFDRPETRRRYNLNASLPDRFINGVAVAIDASPGLARNLEFTSEDLRAVIAFTQLLQPVLEEVRVLERSLSFTIAEKRAKAGGRALYAYSLSQALNRPADSEVLVPHIAAMKAALGPRGRRKATATPTDPPQDAATAKAK